MTQHLLGAYGLFWSKDEVNWSPGSRRSWQLLGKRGVNSGTLQVCDFRRARGFYILFDDYGAYYVGLARGKEGIGQRLKSHVKDSSKSWSRFCWFSFDDVVATDDHGWSELAVRDAVKASSAEHVLRELEALLIIGLGTRDQNKMRFQAAEEWTQVTTADALPRGALHKIDRGRFTDHDLNFYLAE